MIMDFLNDIFSTVIQLFGLFFFAFLLNAFYPNWNYFFLRKYLIVLLFLTKRLLRIWESSTANLQNAYYNLCSYPLGLTYELISLLVGEPLREIEFYKVFLNYKIVRRISFFGIYVRQFSLLV